MAVSTAVDPTAVARVVGIETVFQDLRAGNIANLPQRCPIFGQGSVLATFSSEKLQITSALQAAQVYGFGSPIHLAALQLLPVNGDGVGTIPVTVYPLVDALTAVQSSGNITILGTQTTASAYRISVNNILSEQFVFSVGDSEATMITAMTNAINASLNIPIIAVDNTTQVDYTSKWAGESANNIKLQAVGSAANGTTIVITQPTGGLVNPDIDSALAQMGAVWETRILNCLNIEDTVTLDKFQTFGEGRWGSLVKKPLIVFTGQTESDVNTAIVIPNARPLDRINAQLVAPGCDNLPFVVAARELARILVSTNNNPPHDYAKQVADGLVAGLDGVQWDYPTKNLAVISGSSTTDKINGLVTLSDTVTFYHPEGDELPAYRYVVNIAKISTLIYNTNLIFDSVQWDGAPLLPSNQLTTNPTAKTPSDAKTDLSAMLQSASEEAIISDPTSAKASIVAQISITNPDRLDVSYTIKLSGNSDIISITLNFGYFFGGTA